MNEDEAFIRAIVDSPGDDTARLVYADWLDERDDPRGAYLRAEHEWAATHDPSERDTLRRLVKGLSPVWVARVSRPPAGVCCDHVQFQNCGPKLTSADIDDAESQLEVSVPYQLRAFLLNYNGGEQLLPDFGPDDERPEYDVESWYTLAEIVEQTRYHRQIHPRRTYVSVAFIPDVSELVVEVARGRGFGRVFLWFNVLNEQYEDEAFSYRAPSLANFLATLTEHTED